jgi:hypothetical protein
VPYTLNKRPLGNIYQSIGSCVALPSVRRTSQLGISTAYCHQVAAVNVLGQFVAARHHHSGRLTQRSQFFSNKTVYWKIMIKSYVYTPQSLWNCITSRKMLKAVAADDLWRIHVATYSWGYVTREILVSERRWCGTYSARPTGKASSVWMFSCLIFRRLQRKQAHVVLISFGT